MIKCIAVDDEKRVLDLLEDDIKRVPFLQLVKRCRNAMEAADALRQESIDLIFLDIQMPGLNGLKFVESLTVKPMIIFITAYKEHALEGFNLAAIDYLLKPVSFERFLKACNKAYDYYMLQQKPANVADPGYFFVFVEYNQVKVVIADILYIEGMKDYVKIFLQSTERPVITRMSMKSLEDKLAANRFVRIHKSFIVSVDKIISVKRDLVSLPKTELPLSDNYKYGLEKLLSP
jgi:DNA-binding LytR/AlgR family response regulator